MEVSKASVPPFRELLASELRLDPRQWEEAPRKLLEEAAQTDMLANPPPPPEAVLDIDCLVSLNCDPRRLVKRTRSGELTLYSHYR